MDLFKYPVDLNYVKSHYGSGPRCGIFSDGAQIAPLPRHDNTTSRPLDGMRPFDVLAVMLPGYIGYHDTGVKLSDWLESDRSFTNDLPWEEYLDRFDPSITNLERLGDKNTLIVWCSEMLTMFKHMSQTSGAEVTFRAFPLHGNLYFDFMSLIPRLEQVFVALPLATFSIVPLPVMKPASYITQVEYGNIFLRKRYERLEFVFLRSFDTTSWLFIVGSVCLLGCVLTYLTDFYHSFKDQPVQPPYGSFFHMPALKPIRTSRVTLLGRFFTLMIDLFALLVEQYQKSIGRQRPVFVIGIWLLAVTVLCRCLNGCMREMMGYAVHIIVPENGWSDLFELDAFKNEPIITCNMLPSYDVFKRVYPEIYEPNSTRNDQIFIDIFNPNTHLSGALKVGQAMMTDFNIIIITMNMLYSMLLWVMTIYRPFIAQWFHVMDPTRSGEEILNHALHLMYTEAYGSPGYGSHPIFLLGIFKAQPRYTQYMDELVLRMRDAGFMTVLVDRSESRLTERFFQRDPSRPEKTSSASFTQICLADITDPLQFYGFLLCVSLASLLAEKLINKLLSHN